MSITTELRDWAREQRTGNVLTCHPPKHEIHGVQEDLLAIADRIDTEHEITCVEAYGNGIKSVDISEYVVLPLDSCRQRIHRGDIMATHDGTTFEVRALRLNEDGWEVVDRFGDRYSPYLLHHYHKPTVENILCDMLDEWGELPSDEPVDKIVAKYAAKLQLKEDE